MQVTGNDILNYKGDVALGLGESGGLPQFGDTDTKELNNSMFNLAYLNQQKNKSVWDQKIKDRDDSYRMIREGKLQIDNALPEHRKYLQQQLDKIKDTWLEHGGDIESDPNVWVKFNDDLGKFHDQQSIAATNLKTYQEGLAAAAKETNPLHKEAMLKHWEEEKKKAPDQFFDPYQQTLDWDPQITLPKMEANSSMSRSGYYDVTHTRTNVQKAYLNYINRYQFNDKGVTAPNVDAFYNSYFGIDGLKDMASVGQSVSAVNRKLSQIAKDEGYDPDKPDALPQYLRPIRMLSNDPTTGKPGTADTKQLAAFKVALATNYENAATQKFNKDYAKNEVDMIKARAYAGAQKALGHKYHAQATSIERDSFPEQNFDELKTKSFSTATANGGYETRANWKDLSPNTRKYLGIDPIGDDDQNRFVSLYPTKVVDNSGKAYSDKDVEKYYLDARKSGYKGSMIDYLKSLNMDFDIEAYGRERGATSDKKIARTNRLSTTQNQIKANKLGRKSLYLDDNSQPEEPGSESSSSVSSETDSDQNQ
jgi:hypothetical protein